MPDEDRLGGTVIGVCPECGSDIRAGQTLIVYQRRGENARYADCRGCRAVVHPAPST